jgi:hypothetical protein
MRQAAGSTDPPWRQRERFRCARRPCVGGTPPAHANNLDFFAVLETRPFLEELSMKKVVLAMAAAMVAVSVLAGVSLESASARPQYKMEFDKKYMADGSAMNKALSGKSNCNVCHVGKDRKKRNDYGAALGKALGEKNVKDKEKIEEALGKVEKEKSGDKTFGDLIKDGKLPVTMDEK